MSITISRKTKLLAALGIVLTAAIGVTFAAFTDTGNVATTFTAGTLDLKFDNNQDGNPTAYQVDFSAGFDDLAPGQSVSRDLLVYNSGTVNALASMATPQITNSAGTPTPALQDSLSIVITDTTGTPATLYSGPLANAAFSALAIGANGSANGHTLHMVVTLDAAATTQVAGQSISVILPFNAIQA